MGDPVKELQQLKGIGAVTARRLVAAGLDTFPAIVEAGEKELRSIIGINPRSIPGILEQAATLSGPSAPAAPDPADELKLMVADLRTAIQEIAAAARERFPEALAGKIGRRLTRNMVTGSMPSTPSKSCWNGDQSGAGRPSARPGRDWTVFPGANCRISGRG